MVLLMFLLFYLSLPFVELGIMIALAVSRNHYKKIAEGMEWRAGGAPSPVQADGANGLDGAAASPDMSEAMNKQPAQPQTALPANQAPVQRHTRQTFSQGASAAVIPFVVGVVFVLFAGLIFATTTWSILPSAVKAGLVLLMTALFFACSLLAEKKLHIVRTGKAFYILGSMFLFVTVVAFGYFRLLGSKLVPGGEKQLWLYFFGLFFAELSFLWGIGRFTERIYRALCLYGITACAALFFLACELPPQPFSMAMALFSWGVILAERYLFCGKGGRIFLLKQVYHSYCLANLWLVSVIILFGSGFGILSGLAAFLAGAAHIYRGSVEEREDGEAVAFAACLVAGAAKIIRPEGWDHWMYLLSMTTLLTTVLGNFGWLESRMRKGFVFVHGIQGVLVLFMASALPLISRYITLSSLICMGLLLADVTIGAWKNKKLFFLGVHSAVLLIFLLFAAFYPQMAYDIRIFLVVLALGLLLLAGKKGRYPLRNRFGEILFVIVIFAGAVNLVMIRFFTEYEPDTAAWRFLMETAAVLILTGALWGWKNVCKEVETLLPLAFALAVIPVKAMADFLTGTSLEYDWFLLVCLVFVCAFGMTERENHRDCRMAASILAVFSAAVCFNSDGGNLPYLLCLAVYLLAKGEKPYFYWGCISGLWGIFLVFLGLTDRLTLCFLIPFAVAAVADCWYQRGIWPKEWHLPPAFQSLPDVSAAAQSVLYIMAAVGFYREPDPDIRYLVLLLPAFLWSCRTNCRRRRTWWNLASVLVTLWLVPSLSFHYEVPGDVLYLGVLLGLILVTGLSRKWIPIWNIGHGEGSDKGIFADWFSILQILWILPMALLAEREEWRFTYVLLMAGYALQYTVQDGWRRPAVTAAGAAACVAFWIQPFFPWPEVLVLEISLIPVAALIWGLERIWGRSVKLWNVQTALYVVCLVLLLGHALWAQDVINALILEGICLAVLVVSYVKKCGRFVKISGGMAIAVVFYMTRAFWMSLSWWIYLLAAGIGLILFAGYNELKKH